MATARRPTRSGRVGRQARVMSHRARSALAKPPVEVADRVASVVGSAFRTWADRFVSFVVRDIVQPSDRFKQDADRYDATVRGLFDEAGKARPDPEKIRAAFNILEKQSADELRVNGVPTRTVLQGAERLQADWIRNNTDLIRAESDLRRRVERVLQDPLNEGRSVADISKLLQEQVGYSQSRAELTARDQTLKMYGQIQEQRQTNAGITRYIWTTSLDERVRPDHADLDGSVQQWDEPPIVDQRTGRRGHPGFDFQCRCTAVPVLDEDDVADPAPAQAQRQLRAQAQAEGRFAARPPPERAMVPTQTELERQRAHVEAETRRRSAEAQADARIAAARAAEAERRAAEAAAAQAAERQRAEAERLRAQAEAERQRAEAERRAAEATRIEVERQARAEAEAERRRAEAERRTARKPAERVEFHPDVAQATRTAIEGAVNQVNIPGLKHLEVTPRIPGSTANGNYQPWDGHLRVAAERAVKSAPLPDKPGPGRLWAISATGKTTEDAVRLTTLHEMGHHAHMWGVQRFEDGVSVASAAQRTAGLKADRIVEALFKDPKREYLTDYAGVAPGTHDLHRSSEYFAEAHAAYHAYPAWLQRVAPKAYRAVDDVLRLRREAGL